MTTSGADAHPLALAAAAIRARDGHQVIEVGAPVEPGWFRLDELREPDAVAGELEWIAGADPTIRRGADVAGSYLASGLGSCVLAPAATLLVLEGVLPDVAAGNLWLHRHPAERWYDRVAFERPTFSCTSDHPAASHPDARPAEHPADLVEALAVAAVGLLVPLFTAVRAVAPYGMRGMWGSLADDLVTALVWITRPEDGDCAEQEQAWRAGVEIVDAVAAQVPLLRVRPTPVEVTWSAGTTLFCRRGTCCLYYKSNDALAHPEPDRYCSSCPLRDPSEQRSRWAAWLESTATTAG